MCYYYSLTVIHQQTIDNRKLGKSCSSVCVSLRGEMPLWWKMPSEITSDNKICALGHTHELNETFPYYEAHGNLFFSLNSFMPQKQPLIGSMQTVSQQTLWHGHHRKTSIPTSLQSGGRSDSHLVEIALTSRISSTRGKFVVLLGSLIVI